MRVRQTGFSLVELTVAIGILSLMIATGSSLLSSVVTTETLSSDLSVLHRDGQQILARLNSHLAGATTSKRFPGVWVVTRRTSNVDVPSILVVWSNADTSKDFPSSEEIVIFGTSITAPNELLELRLKDSIPLPTDSNGWQSLAEAAFTDPGLTQSRTILSHNLDTESNGDTPISNIIFAANDFPSASERDRVVSKSASPSEIGSIGDNYLTFKSVVSFEVYLTRNTTRTAAYGAQTLVCPF